LFSRVSFMSHRAAPKMMYHWGVTDLVTAGSHVFVCGASTANSSSGAVKYMRTHKHATGL
jgi:hypothetical protein